MEFNQDIFQLAKENTFFRKEVATAKYSQVVLMSIPPGGEIGEETHNLDQILVFVQGEGKSILNGKEAPVKAGRLVVVPTGTRHNFINTGKEDLKLFTVYAPPEHKPGTVHKTKAEADAAEHH
jgi:mannose-6-phosphate isomerase-like protein (cupin superfamily)